MTDSSFLSFELKDMKLFCVFTVFFSLSRSGTMLEGYSPVTQALLGTLLTWGLTAAGAALVFVFSSRQVIKKKKKSHKALKVGQTP